MTYRSGVHKKKTLALAVGWALACQPGPARAQGADDGAAPPQAERGAIEEAERGAIEEVMVYGVRASQAKSIDIKREAVNIVDSIVAEDIGKLPDTTITDSLQRITGVQIRREANEGTSLNIRGMPQVLTTLNGEQFLSPWNITDVGANYSDIPAGMISGVDVYKSMSAESLAGGISGLVDLKTFRPTQLQDGWTTNLRMELSQGSRSDQEVKSDGSVDSRNPDHNLSLFSAFNQEGDWGVAVGLFHNATYAANYQMFEDQRLAFLRTPGGSPHDPLDLNADGDTDNDWYLVPQEFGARSNFMEREREGGSISLEAGLSDNFIVRGDVFYTRMDQYDRGVKAAFNGRHNKNAYEVNGDYPNLEMGEYTDLYNALLPTSRVGTGADITYVDRNGVTRTRSLHTLQVAAVEAVDFQTISTNNINRTAALNTNLELEYTNNDNLTGKLRVVYAEAEKQFRKAELQQGAPAWLWMDVDGISGKDPIQPYYVTVDYRSEIPSFAFDADLANADLLQVYQGFGEGENTDAKLGVVRGDVTYTFATNDFHMTSLDAGLRYGVRDADHSKFFYVMPTGRYSTWDDPRVAAEDRFRLREGNDVWQKYPEWRRFDFSAEDQRLVTIGGMEDNGFSRADTIAFTDFGPISGFENGVSALNPSAWDDPLAFFNRLYPGARTAYDPGYNYSVKEEALSPYVQLNFANDEGLAGVPFGGNFGVRVVRTEREVTRNVIPEVLDRFNSLGFEDWQKIAYVYDQETIRDSFTDVLPSFNINFYPADEWTVRFGAARTMSNNNLHDVGSGLTLWYQRCPKVGEDGNLVLTRGADGRLVAEEVSCVGGGNDQGDPYRKPWRADVYNTSAEWYFGENSILGAGLFLIDVETSVETFQEQRTFVDGDGIDRNRTANVWVSDNVGASNLVGFEMGYKQPFTFLPGEYLSALGMEFNYTYSDSESNDRDIQGEAFPLPSNSEHQANMILWYDKGGLNVRVAYNWRSEEYLGRVGLNTNEATLNLGNWLEPTGYLDMSVNYWINKHLSVHASGTNLTEQHRISYSQFEDQFHSLWIQERRFALGLTITL